MMRKSYKIFTLVTIGLLLFLLVGVNAKEPANARSQLSFDKTLAGGPTRTVANVGNWTYWMYHDGTSGITPGGDGGGIYPRGTANVIYEDGFIWGCFVEGETAPKVGGQTYRTGTQPGWIVTPGDGTNPPVAIDPNDDRARIYRIRTDWRTLTHSALLLDAVDIYQLNNVDQVTEAMTSELMDQYKADWKDWPVDLGAPFMDNNGNGIYDPVLDDEGYPIYSDTTDYPGVAKADQVVWFVCNDLDPGRATNLYGSEPIGLELQVTAWMYNQPENTLGQIIFKKYKLINKSGKRLDSMYVAQWCDPDVGQYTDDLVGCDTTLSVGFAYNGSESDDIFSQFNLPPAAVGYDFFQGPMVKGVAGQDLNRNGIDDAEDYAVFDLKRIGPGYINLPMTSFGYFSAGNQEWSDPQLGVYTGTLEWYNLLRGFITLDDIVNPTPFYEHNDKNGKPTKFPLAGDPINGDPNVDDIDGAGGNFAPADRRMALSTGPFVMQPGDTQEVVVAIIGGLGGSRLQSVADMKSSDVVAQIAYDSLFQVIPKPPAAPLVKATGFENEIVLNWGWNHEAVKETEEKVIINYHFEGYNVYQLPSPTAKKDQAVRIATFDLVNDVRIIKSQVFVPEFGTVVDLPVQFGSDAGIQRYIVIDKNYITGEPLYPGNTYYFAVTAYNYDPNLIRDRALESALTVIPVTTQSTLPGVRYNESPGQQIEVTHTGGSDGVVEVTVVNPGEVTGHEYEVFFTEDTDTNSATYGMILWNLKDVTTGQMVLENQIQVEDPESNDAPIVDGLLVKVSGPAPGIKAIVEVANGNGPLPPEDWDAAGAPFGGNNVWHSLSAPSDPNRFYISAGGGAGDIDRMARSIANAESHDFEMRFTDTGGIYLWWYDNDAWTNVPFEWWDIGINTWDDQTDDVRGITGGYSGGVTPGDFDFGYTDPAFGFPATDWIYLRVPLDDQGTYDAFYNDVTSGALTYNWWFHSKEVIARTIICDFGGAGTLPETGTKIRWITNKPNSTEDVFTFSTQGATESLELAKQDVDKISVYPNPYYAANPQEPNRFTRFVTFYHLPKRAKIRIFNLAGNLVRTLEKDDNSQFFRWDLKNENKLPVASGIYIAHIDMPDLGKEKVVKIFIIQPAQILEYY